MSDATSRVDSEDPDERKTRREARKSIPRGARSVPVNRIRTDRLDSPIGTPGAPNSGRGRDESDDDDVLVIEEPLEIRFAGRPVATVLRTPKDDFDLAMGYLFAEGWIESRDNVAEIRGGADVESADDGAAGIVPQGESPKDGNARRAASCRNVVDVIPARGFRVPKDAGRRSTTATSSCGVCGKRTISEALALRASSVDIRADGLVIDAPRLVGFPDRMRRRQEIFESTGGLHAAGLFSRDGELLSLREDIGRHNAVDKLAGEALRDGRIPLDGHILQVSGRVSFEIVQKAFRAGIPVVSAVSGVSSLAVELAERAGITLIGFVRSGRLNVYTHAARVLETGALRSR
jgi:FdhD protein